MAIKLNKKDMKKFNINTVDIKKNDTPKDRLQRAIEKVSKNNYKDKIFFNEDFSVCILEINDTALLSNNDILRVDNRALNKLKKAWHNRIVSLVKNKDIKQWESIKSKQILVEILYRPSSGKFLDPDAISAAFKAPLDGLIEAKLINDDNLNHVPLIIPRQEKSLIKGETQLIIVLSELKDINKYYSSFFYSLINV